MRGVRACVPRVAISALICRYPFRRRPSPPHLRPLLWRSVLITRGGHDHPYQLIKNKMLSDQRADFLKSRPHFNDTYFDGQRDQAAGWVRVCCDCNLFSC
jgi:hypothetical protein